MKRVFDVSQAVAPGIRVWPGDRPYERAWTWKMADGASCNVGQVAMSCHTGTHFDAPYHFDASGEAAEAIPLAACLGPCVVLPLDRLAEARGEERVLVRSGGSNPAVADVDAMEGLRLFGTDAPSVDAMDSRTLDVHHALAKRGVAILEGLDLSAVADGRYELIALPLKLSGMDAAPARVLLREA